MKNFALLVVVVASLTWVSAAHADYYSLVDCQYRFVPEFGQSKYVGSYRSSFGNLWTGMFDSYCPASINQGSGSVSSTAQPLPATPQTGRRGYDIAGGLRVPK